MNLETHQVQCPYCNEAIELAIEPVDGLQEYIEDCHVCCQPITVQVNRDEFNQSLAIICKSGDEI